LSCITAVDQLGSDKAVVRHGGLYALELVAQNNSTQRQTVVDAICAYLRPLNTPPGSSGARRLGAAADLHHQTFRRAGGCSRARRDPLGARSPAHRPRILTRHLRPQRRRRPPAQHVLAHINLALTSATASGVLDASR
jgi:hypothetical protein